ncbi:MAG: DUF4142 domain-containing protein [Mycobacteriales bacterium]
MRRLSAAPTLILSMMLAGLGWSGTATAAAPSGQDRAYLQAAHQLNLAEISAGRLGLARAGSGELRRHAKLFLDDHQRLDAEVRALAERLAVPLPTAPTRSQQAQLVQLSARSGSSFDAAWLDQQVALLRHCLQVGRTQLARGSDAQARALARRAAPVVQAHLAILRETAADRRPDAVEGGAGGAANGEPARRAPLGLALIGVAVVLAAGALLVLQRRRRA